MTRRRGRRRGKLLDDINPLKAELNPICHLLALLGAHHILHVSRIRVKERRGYSSFEGGSSRSHYVESWLWTRLRTCRKTLLNEWIPLHVHYDRHARNLRYHVRLINCEEHFRAFSTHCAVHNFCLLWGTFETHNDTLCRLLAASMSGRFFCLHYEAGSSVHLVIPCPCNFILFSESWEGGGWVGEMIQINRQKPRIWVCKSHMAGQPCHTLLRLTRTAPGAVNTDPRLRLAATQILWDVLLN